MLRKWFCFSSWIIVRLLTSDGHTSANVLGVSIDDSGSAPGDVVSVTIELLAYQPLSAVRIDLLVPPLLVPSPEVLRVGTGRPFVSFFRTSFDTLRIVAIDSIGLPLSPTDDGGVRPIRSIK